MISCWGLLAFMKAADTRPNASFTIKLPKRIRGWIPPDSDRIYDGWDEDYDDYYDDEYYDEYDDGYDDGYDAPYDDGRDYYDPPPDYGGYQDDWAPPPDYGQDREPTLYWRRGTPPDPDRDMDFQDTARYRFDQTERRDRR